MYVGEMAEFTEFKQKMEAIGTLLLDLSIMQSSWGHARVGNKTFVENYGWLKWDEVVSVWWINKLIGELLTQGMEGNYNFHHIYFRW